MADDSARPAISAVTSRREAWARALIDSRLDQIASVFRDDDTDPPVVVWNPDPASLRSAPIRFVLDHWTKLRCADKAPTVASLDALALRPALGYVMLVDPVGDILDFRYRLYGSLIAAVSGIDLTGKLVSQHHASPHVVDFSFASYLAVHHRPEPLYTFRRPARTEFTRAWERLVLPLLDERGSLGRFLVVNVPEDDAGSTIRPAF